MTHENLYAIAFSVSAGLLVATCVALVLSLVIEKERGPGSVFIKCAVASLAVALASLVVGIVAAL